jgi:hypothetical protein
MTHFFVGALGTGTVRVGRLWFLSFFCSALPDIDAVITRLAAKFLHMRLGGMWWDHRAFSQTFVASLSLFLLSNGISRSY